MGRQPDVEAPRIMTSATSSSHRRSPVGCSSRDFPSHASPLRWRDRARRKDSIDVIAWSRLSCGRCCPRNCPNPSSNRPKPTSNDAQALRFFHRCACETLHARLAHQNVNLRGLAGNVLMKDVRSATVGHAWLRGLPVSPATPAPTPSAPDSPMRRTRKPLDPNSTAMRVPVPRFAATSAHLYWRSAGVPRTTRGETQGAVAISSFVENALVHEHAQVTRLVPRSARKRLRAQQFSESCIEGWEAYSSLR